MIIPRHKVCDICRQPVGINKRYYKIKSKDWLAGYAGSVSDNITHHICEDCMHEFKTYLKSKLKSKEMDEDAKQASIPYTYNAPQHDWKCGYPSAKHSWVYNKIKEAEK